MSNEESSQLPKDKAELLQRIEREWELLENAIHQVSHRQMSVPDSGGWSIKDNLAHLATWERFLRLYHLRDLPPYDVMGVERAAFEKLDENELNAIIFERNKDRSAEEIIAELENSHRQVLADLERIPFNDLMKARKADDPGAGLLIQWVIGNTYEHYREHGVSIQRLVQQIKAHHQAG